VPPDKYEESNPEFFSMREDGTRPAITAYGSQLCLSNPELFNTLVENLRELISERPHLKYWSVSQEDSGPGANHCFCDGCIDLMERYGGDRERSSGAFIYFVNKVAREFPDYMISTLAYRFTREAPDNITPEPNVNIMLCNIESQRHKPVYETDPAFSKDLENWGRIAGDILIWDYNVQFSNYYAPFPNLHTIKPNINFFTDNNVNALFMQGNGFVGGEMAELRAYLISKLMWNPDADDDAIIDDFLDGYYGAAGRYIRQYIDTMRHALLESGHGLEIYTGPPVAKDTYLTAEMMDEYKRLFDKAEKAVKGDAELLGRVRIARMPIMYAEIQIGSTETDTPRSLYKRIENGRLAVKPEAEALLHQFVALCKEKGVTHLKEPGLTPDEYLEIYNRVFNKINEVSNSISYNKKIVPVTLPASHTRRTMGGLFIDWYEGLEALTRGHIVPFAYLPWSNVSHNWVGYEGEHMSFILDLGEVMPVESVNMYFYARRHNQSREFLPEYVAYSTSLDGENFSESLQVVNPYKRDEAYEVNERSFFEHSFKADMGNRKARFIKVHAENILHCPSWHLSSGSPAIIVSDAIVVK
jgi:hypothetical protein